MQTYSKKIGVLCFLIFVMISPIAIRFSIAAEDINQKILDLRKQIEELTKQAAGYKKNVQQKRKEADTLARQIAILNNEIAGLQTQISITERQIGTARIEIFGLETEIFETQEQIISKKEAIGEIVFSMYERDRLNLAAVLLANPRLSDFLSQAQHEENLNLRLNSLLADLKIRKNQLESDKSALELKKRELERLNNQHIAQKNSAAENKSNKNRLLQVTKGKETEYQKLLNAVEKKKAAFFEELQKLETEALKSGAFIVHVKADKIPPKGKIFHWPEEDFYLTQAYGLTAYARRGVYGGAPHNGVDLVSGFGSAIHPISDGNVLASGFNDGWGNWIAIRHDNGLVSLYSHLKSPSGLANGTSVDTASVIGYEGTTGNSTGSHLHLSLYYDFFTFINPKNGQIYFNYFDGTLNPLDYL